MHGPGHFGVLRFGPLVKAYSMELERRVNGKLTQKRAVLECPSRWVSNRKESTSGLVLWGYHIFGCNARTFSFNSANNLWRLIVIKWSVVRWSGSTAFEVAGRTASSGPRSRGKMPPDRGPQDALPPATSNAGPPHHLT